MIWAHLIRARSIAPAMAALLLSACAQHQPAAEDDSASLLRITETSAPYIRHASLVSTKDSVFVRGHLRRGAIGHTRRPYYGHIDLAVMDPAGKVMESTVIRLNGRQEYFYQRLQAPPPPGGTVTLTYVKTSHPRHNAP